MNQRARGQHCGCMTYNDDDVVVVDDDDVSVMMPVTFGFSLIAARFSDTNPVYAGFSKAKESSEDWRSRFFTGRMPFLSSNQRRQNTEAVVSLIYRYHFWLA